MNRVLLIAPFIVTPFVVVPFAVAVQSAEPVRRPNVIILFPDQLRWSALGCYGNELVRTPHMDRLATGGVRFTHGFSNYPVCSPARSILLSGQHVRSTGVYLNQDTEAIHGRPTNRTATIAEAFAGAGYTTHLVGKWHLAPTPQTLGFQYSLRPHLQHRYYNQTFYRNEKDVYVHPGYSEQHLTNEAIRLIQERNLKSGSRPKPFFLYLSYGPPHMPVDEMPDKYRKMYDPVDVPLRKNAWKDGKLAFDENWFKIYLWGYLYLSFKSTFDRELPEGMDLRNLVALYYGQVAAVDDCIGQVLDALKEAGLEEDTLVLLASDHGDLLGSHHRFNKGTHHDESCRVPMIVRYPRKLKPHVVDTQVVSLVDVMPTLLELCGVEIPKTVQGTSVASVLTGNETIVDENAAIIEGFDWIAVHTLRHVYSVPRDKRRGEQLFDTEQDPYEMKNLADDPAQRDRVNELHARVEAWRQRTALPDGTCLSSSAGKDLSSKLPQRSWIRSQRLDWKPPVGARKQ